MLKRVVAHTLPLMPRALVATVARSYVAGDTMEDARRVVGDLVDRDCRTTLDILGEQVARPEDAEQAVAAYRELADTLPHWPGGGERNGISVKPSHFHLLRDPDAAMDRLRRLADFCAERGVFLRLDMEDRHTTDATLAAYRELRRRHPGLVGCVLQAALFRTRLDVADMAGEPDHDVRLCKGIYHDPPDVAWQERDGVRRNYLHLVRQLLEGGVRLRVATHDPPMVSGTRAIVDELGVPPEQVEFQALLGVPFDATLRELREAGYPVRLYVPFGSNWYAYSVRRVRESPDMVGHVLRNLLTRSSTA